MGSAPAWVAYLSLGIAAASMVAACLSTTVAVFAARTARRTYDRAGVKVQVSYSWQAIEVDDLHLQVEIVNSGLAEVTVQEIRVVAYFSPLAIEDDFPGFPELLPLGSLPRGNKSSGPTLPHRLRGADTKEWSFNALPLIDLEGLGRRLQGLRRRVD
jgi:hypothetical protein